MAKKFKDYQYVSFMGEDGKLNYGCIQKYSKKNGTYHIYCNSLRKCVELTEDLLTLVPAKNIYANDLKSVLRYECTLSELIGEAMSLYNIRLKEEYAYTLDDMETAVKNLRDKNISTEELYELAEFISDEDTAGDFYFAAYDDLTDTEQAESDMAAMIFDTIYETYNYYPPEKSKIYFDVILRDIEHFRQGEDFDTLFWSHSGMVNYVENINLDNLVSESEEALEMMRKLILDLSEQGEPEALVKLGYSYYGGNLLFPCDWIKSRDCFLQLMETDKIDDERKAWFANTLGYIFYYGRCTDGVPEYEKAFHYFSLGAAHYIHESMYKLADLYLNGKGTEKSKSAAIRLYKKAHEYAMSFLTITNFQSKAADTALRMGNLCRDGIIDGDAYYYYTLADFAIRKRLKYNHYGDTSVFSSIQGELNRIRQNNPLKPMTSIKWNYSYTPVLIKELLHEYPCRVMVKNLKNDIKFTLKRIPHPHIENAEKIVECYPEYGYCELTDEISFKVSGIISNTLPKGNFAVDDIGWHYNYDEEIITISFILFGEENGTISCKKVIHKPKLPSKADMTECTFASVVFRTGGHTYDYILEDESIKVGDKVVVFANEEEKVVDVVRIYKTTFHDMPLERLRYKKILRKV